MPARRCQCLHSALASFRSRFPRPVKAQTGFSGLRLERARDCACGGRLAIDRDGDLPRRQSPPTPVDIAVACAAARSPDKVADTLPTYPPALSLDYRKFAFKRRRQVTGPGPIVAVRCPSGRLACRSAPVNTEARTGPEDGEPARRGRSDGRRSRPALAHPGGRWVDKPNEPQAHPQPVTAHAKSLA
jgi:hypothetical protein